MDWLANHLPHTVGAIFGAIIAVDHALAGASEFVPNSAWQLARALFTKTPIRALPALKGDLIMSKFLDELEAGIKRMHVLAEDGLVAVEKLAEFAGKMAPVAAQIAPLCGPVGAEVAAGAAATEALAPLAAEVAGAAANALETKDAV